MTRLLAIAVTVSALGCALTSRGSVLNVQYFSPEPPPAHEQRPPLQRNIAIRLGRVRSAPFLRERIVYRTSDYEVGFYDDREWTERPEFYVRRALQRKLFDEWHFEERQGSTASTLDVELLAFEERQMPPFRAARVKVRYQIRNGDAVIEAQTVTEDRAVSGDSCADFVAAISQALDGVAERIAGRLVQLAPSLAPDGP